ALQRWGIDAIVGESFASIFAGNCLALGIPTVTASPEEIGVLQAYVEENPDEPIAIDVERELVTYGSGDEETAVNADVADAQHKALVEGVWDTTALMKANANAVRETAGSLPYMESDD
ncbi:3-isopropylmalate dehydratase small subunit 2, partial [Halalkalicoccus subterraneus]|uniref:3-isopropylmalate dehydratase small subunit 2 n=1 Tax=Halalkalicoccus subterraneus TaxID=2675002 RepID=UPI0034A47499